MSRIEMRQKVTGTRNGSDWPEPGGIADVTESEADTLVRRGMAERVEQQESEPARRRETKPSPASARREKR